jgi:molybdopterin-guanine dinucleotide biosynthesis protein A
MKGPNFKRARERPANEPIGVILAGGRGRRMGGSKATVELCGKPLISYPLKAMEAALSEVVVLAKADTELPNLPGATVWIEPDPRRHPLVGVMQALALAGGRTVLICAGDLPFVAPELLRRLAGEDPRGSPAVLAAEHGQMQPLLGCYQPRALALLRGAGADTDAPLRERVAAIGPRLLEVDEPDMLFNVNAPEDLLRAAAILDRRGSPTGARRGG